jgi:beta-N-acetylhexosaminidase
MVGYRDVTDLRPLVTSAAVAGVFIAKRNAENADAVSLAGDVTFLQDLRARAGLPPLWIASDQEGGLVSSLSPPLPRPRPLSAFAGNPDNLREAAADAAKDIACLGLNVDFAPVVDLKGVSNPADRFSRIAERSISADPEVVTKTAGVYCEVLAKEGVLCTLKHFPGLGRVGVDTHVREAVLADLDPSDLAPFRELAQTLSPRPWVMLSHAAVASLDAAHPASASRPVIDILRHDWGFDGMLVTDDAWMAPYRRNLEDNLLGTLAGGADIVLIAYDPDLTYRVLDTLLRARRSGRLPDDALRASDERLARLRPPRQAVGCPSTLSHVAFLPAPPMRRRPAQSALAGD